MLRRFGEIPVASLYPILSFDDKRFLSPRGDKLQLAMMTTDAMNTIEFSSPRGDKLQHVFKTLKARGYVVSVPSRG